jgi:hypothetical protein
MIASLDEEITALKASITRYEGMLEQAETSEDRNIILAAITARSNTLNLLIQKSEQGKIAQILLIRTCNI